MLVCIHTVGRFTVLQWGVSLPDSDNVLCCCAAHILQAVSCGCVVRHDGAVRGNSLEDHGQVSGEAMPVAAVLYLCQIHGTVRQTYIRTCIRIYVPSLEWRDVLCYGFVNAPRAVDMMTYTHPMITVY